LFYRYLAMLPRCLRFFTDNLPHHREAGLPSCFPPTVTCVYMPPKLTGRQSGIATPHSTGVFSAKSPPGNREGFDKELRDGYAVSRQTATIPPQRRRDRGASFPFISNSRTSGLCSCCQGRGHCAPPLTPLTCAISATFRVCAPPKPEFHFPAPSSVPCCQSRHERDNCAHGFP
jgi:hypothetical protein